MTTSYRIEGLNCGHCVATVQQALDAKGIAAKVSLDPPQVTLTGAGAPAHAAVAAIVAAAGDYKLGGAVAAAPDKGGLLGGLRKALKL